MATYIERKRIADRDAAEAAGEDLWTEELGDPVRGKLIDAYGRLTDSVHVALGDEVQRIVLRQLRSDTGDLSPADIIVALKLRETDLVLSYIEGIFSAIVDLTSVSVSTELGDYWSLSVNQIFTSHRIKFKFVDGEMWPLDSEELHTEIIEPMIFLMRGHPEMEKAQTAYRKALKEIAANDPGDAITDAGTALQEALTASGCEGRNLGGLISSAKNKGLFGSNDAYLTEGIEKMLVWAAAERNDGEAHKVVETRVDDAWLMVHIVGALIIRLAGNPRGTV